MELSMVPALQQVNDGVYIRPDHIIEGEGFVTMLLRPESQVQPFIVPRVSINHTNGGKNSAGPAALWQWASRLDVTVEPHLQFGSDGTVGQYQYFNRRADCSAAANRYKLGLGSVWYGAIAHETQDDGYKTNPAEVNSQPWTFLQLVRLIQAHTAECATYDIRCSVPTHQFDSGIGHHSQFPSWSLSGHSCPGSARIRQMDVIRREVALRLIALHELTGWCCP